ncbi:MAG: TolC family protein [Candidatus Saganbacteria bacterium]|nr:TolC family protein [Candidatus Saganbacteria bacterium]
MKRSLICCLILFTAVSLTAARAELSLKQSIEIALAQSPLVLKARFEVEAAEGGAGQAFAGFLPQLSLSGGLGKYYSEPQTMQVSVGGVPQTFIMGTDEQADSNSLQASLSQAIFTGGKLSNSLGMANKRLAAAKQELKRVGEEVRFNVINGYFSVVTAQKMVELSNQSLEMAGKHMDRIKAMLQVGMSTKADLLRTEVQQAKAEIGLTRAKQGLEIARNSFNNALGRELSSNVDLAEVEYNTANIKVYSDEELQRIAFSERPDWQQFQLAKQISADEVGLAYSDLWPMVSLVGQYDVGSTKYSSYQIDLKTWTALISASWNIFDGTATWNRIKQARAKLSAQQADELQVRRGIELEIRDANFTLKSAIENLASTAKAEELADENYRIAGLRYDSGVGTNLEVIDAQVSLTQARTEQLQAKHDLQIAQARLNKLIGHNIY